jgi:hypothetical protein
MICASGRQYQRYTRWFLWKLDGRKTAKRTAILPDESRPNVIVEHVANLLVVQHDERNLTV